MLFKTVFAVLLLHLPLLATPSPFLAQLDIRNTSLVQSSPAQVLRREAQTIRCIFPADPRVHLQLRPQRPHQVVSLALLENAAENYIYFYENRMPLAQRYLLCPPFLYHHHLQCPLR